MHLHLHSNYSVIDGRGLIEDYIKLAKADSQPALALTDHGTLGGAIEAYTACKKADIKFIPGMEMYVDAYEVGNTENKNQFGYGHLTVLAKNEAGYRALIAANNLAHRQFYQKPRISLQQILERGLCRDWIILSGCMSGTIYKFPQSEAIEVVKNLAANCAGFFLEFMWHYSEDEQFQFKQNTYLERMADIHKQTGLPLVITNDCHYAYKHHEDIHQELLRQAKGTENELEFDGEGFYFKTMAQMQEIANSLGVPNAVDNAVAIANSCDVHIPESDKISWYVPDITGGHPEANMVSLCEAALESKGLPQEYYERYHYELSVLKTSPAILNSYLVTYDLVSWCDSGSIPVAARGSMGGSLISWLLGITKEDPIKYSLSFSRAVNPARPTIPDFDLDVSSSRRGEILDYLRERYAGNIPIAAYTHYGPKGALRKVMRMEGLHNPVEMNEICKPLPDDWADGDFEYSPTGKTYVGKVPWFDLVPENYKDFTAIYKGLYSTMSVHPSGVLISGPERELENEVPLQWIGSSKTLVSAFDMYTLKKIGLFKLDVLGLRTLDQLAYMEKVSEETLPDDDYAEPEVLSAFGADLLAEVFQMDGYACREVIRSIQGIRTFEDIIAANTLARPGCSQFTPFYRSGFEGLIREYPSIAEILGPTNGLILYQEQVMEIARVLADFDDAEQDDVKESIKYFNHTNWSQTIEPLFKGRCEAKGFDATNILAAIAQMASYTYNRAHAMTYAAIAYKMMWYKVHHPAIYYAAVYDAADDKQRLVLESHFFNVKWSPPDINRSEAETTIQGNEILLGLCAIKGVGPAAFSALAKARPFTTLEDLEGRVERRKCNIGVIGHLKESYALSSLGVEGTFSAFQEFFGFNPRYLDSSLVTDLSSWYGVDKVGGFITEIRSFKINKPGPNQGKEMANVSIVNIRGKKRCVLFPDVWSKARGKLYQGAAVKLEGEFQSSGDFIVSKGYEC